MTCDDGGKLGVSLGNITNTGSRALIFIIDPHMRDQNNGIDLWLDLLNDLFHFLYRISEMDAIDAIRALGKLGSHGRVHADNADFNSLAFNDFIRGEVGFA
ncbi:Uncharacterised protein [Yersinia enterocolitica]|nr:Uncharacterised protein [Yersinia enterocolitica]